MQLVTKHWDQISRVWFLIWAIIAIVYVLTHFPFPQMEIVYENY